MTGGSTLCRPCSQLRFVRCIPGDHQTVKQERANDSQSVRWLTAGATVCRVPGGMAGSIWANFRFQWSLLISNKLRLIDGLPIALPAHSPPACFARHSPSHHLAWPCSLLERSLTEKEKKERERQRTRPLPLPLSLPPSTPILTAGPAGGLLTRTRQRDLRGNWCNRRQEGREKRPWAKWPFSDALAVGVVGIAQRVPGGKAKERKTLHPWEGFPVGECGCGIRRF